MKLTKKEVLDLSDCARSFQGKQLGCHYGNLRSGDKLQKLGYVEQRGSFMYATAAGLTALTKSL
jgi:hypothetical protein